MRVYAIETRPDINWSVDPSGTARENAVVECLLDDMRLSHSIVAED